MKLWFKNFRISILNWLAAGRITIMKDEKPQVYNMAYTIGGGAGMGGISLGPQTQGPITGQTLTIKITPASGGNIVSVASSNFTENLYIIADDADFDRELGKIITMSKLKE